MSTPPGVETRGPAIVGTAIALPIFAACFIGARIYTRVHIIHFFGIDDWVAIATLVVSVAYSVCLGIWTHHGGGMHQYDMTDAIETEYYKWLLIASEFYALALLGYKTAILLLYIRLFKVNKNFVRFCYVVMAINAAYLLSNIILQIFSCTPVPKFYDKSLPGHCVSLKIPDILWGAMSMLSDFAIAWLPIPIVWRLKLSRQDKILVSLVFLSGLIAFVMAATRWIIATVDLTSEDQTWIAGLAFLFSIVEVNTGIICGCTATLKPLFRFAREHTSRRRSSGTDAYRKEKKRHRRRQPEPSTQESEKPMQRLQAPPGTLNMSEIGKSVDREESPKGTTGSLSPISRATTARPSMADTRPRDQDFSQDLLNLPREGTNQQPRLHTSESIPQLDSVPVRPAHEMDDGAERLAPHQMV